MEFRIIIQRAAAIFIESLFHRPGENVSQRIKVKMKVQRNLVIQPEALVVKRSAVDQTTAECNHPAFLTPDKKSSLLRHGPAQLAKIFFGQMFKLHAGPLVDLKIKGINFIDVWRNVVSHLHLDPGGALGLAEFSA